MKFRMQTALFISAVIFLFPAALRADIENKKERVELDYEKDRPRPTPVLQKTEHPLTAEQKSQLEQLEASGEPAAKESTKAAEETNNESNIGNIPEELAHAAHERIQTDVRDSVKEDQFINRSPQSQRRQ